MLAALICSLFGFFCAPGEAPGREAWERVQREARELPAIVGRASVIDGDTIEIHGRRIRLQAVDAPESGQWCGEGEKRWRCGQASAERLAAMIGESVVTCRQDPRDAEDRYGRALGMCEAGGADLNLGLVREGLAVAYRQYLDYRGGEPRAHKAAYLAAEAEARAARRGMWAGPFQMPWEWRAERRGAK